MGVVPVAVAVVDGVVVVSVVCWVCVSVLIVVVCVGVVGWLHVRLVVVSVSLLFCVVCVMLVVAGRL